MAVKLMLSASSRKLCMEELPSLPASIRGLDLCGIALPAKIRHFPLREFALEEGLKDVHGLLPIQLPLGLEPLLDQCCKSLAPHKL